MSAQILPPTTAGIYPEKFSDDHFFTRNRKLLVVFLSIFTLLGFGLRIGNLGAESLSEDELNKLQTVAEYRANGLSGRNGEHPFLMKGLQTASITLSEKWNNSISSESGWRISEEAALRFPTALFGTFTALLLYLLFSELFGSTIGLITAALWAVDPIAIGFDRVAKEDSFLLFFFLLANVFWMRAQSAAERGKDNWLRYVWCAAAAFGAMVASKYLPHLLAISAAYYKAFLAIPAACWRLGKLRWLKFLVVMGIAFLVCNPTILIPETWREMMTFSGEKRIGHDSYEFMGMLYKNQMTAWLSGVPWTFYYVFIAVKTPLLTLFFFLVGLPMYFKNKLGDGRIFVFFWAFMWFMPFSVLGGKFTRYFTVAEPLVLLTAAIGFYFAAQWLLKRIFSNSKNSAALHAAQILLFIFLIGSSLLSSISVAPHFRLHTNVIGGGTQNAGNYFPHDEFYDMSTREIVAELAARARPSALVANETPILFEHYAQKVNPTDLVFVSLSDKSKVETLQNGDFIVVARGRRYFSNSAYLDYLEKSVQPIAEIKAGEISSAKIYQLDEASLSQIRALTK